MALLSQQTVEEKTGKPRKSEDGFLGSALLGSSFPTAAAAMEVVVEEEGGSESRDAGRRQGNRHAHVLGAI